MTVEMAGGPLKEERKEEKGYHTNAATATAPVAMGKRSPGEIEVQKKNTLHPAKHESELMHHYLRQACSFG